MIHVVASLSIKEEAFDKWLEIFKANVPNVLAEDGCLDYQPHIDFDSGWKLQKKDPLTVTILERWESMEALNAHAKAAHMSEMREASKGMVAAMELKVLRQA